MSGMKTGQELVERFEKAVIKSRHKSLSRAPALVKRLRLELIDVCDASYDPLPSSFGVYDNEEEK